jgi:ABC-type transport system involved in multi-copper enzyme maturation permease subunit
MLASFFSVGIWIVGHLTRDLRDIGAASGSESMQQATQLLHRVMPDLETFDFSVGAARGLAFGPSDFWLPLVYGAGYISVLLMIAIAIFERRDFR